MKTTADVGEMTARRTIFCRGVMDYRAANLVVGQLLFLDSVDPDTDIQMIIRVSGGSRSATLPIWDTIQFITPKVVMTVHGEPNEISDLLTKGP